MQITNRQTQVVETVRAFVEEHEYGPSLRELAKRLDITPVGAQHHLDVLEAKGLIQRTRGVARSVRVCRPMI